MTPYQEPAPEPEDYESMNEYRRDLAEWYRWHRDPDDVDEYDLLDNA